MEIKYLMREELTPEFQEMTEAGRAAGDRTTALTALRPAVVSTSVIELVLFGREILGRAHRLEPRNSLVENRWREGGVPPSVTRERSRSLATYLPEY